MGDPVTAETLRNAAEWLDAYDEMAVSYFDLLVKLRPAGFKQPSEAMREACRGTELQDDLRRWADALERGSTHLERLTQLLDDMRVEWDEEQHDPDFIYITTKGGTGPLSGVNYPPTRFVFRPDGRLLYIGAR